MFTITTINAHSGAPIAYIESVVREHSYAEACRVAWNKAQDVRSAGIEAVITITSSEDTGMEESITV